MADDNKFTYSSFRLCEYKGQFFRLCRHLPVLSKKIKRRRYGAQPILDTEAGRDILKEAAKAGGPFMAARFGTTEGAVFTRYWKTLLNEKAPRPGFSEQDLSSIFLYSGFFPKDDAEALWKWCEQETAACRELDLLGVMNFINEEWIVRNLCPQAKLMPCSGLASAAKGWAHVLEDKKVLVVHPFTDTIRKQYTLHREQIFPGTNALPRFDLKCVKAVQTIADQQDERFATWFEALDYMTEEIRKQDFDVALLGCGAYGFQLAARVKQMGKTAVHMGGSLQTLFGIKGARWDVQYSDMYNDAWVYPSEEERPAGYEKVEGGCYWQK